MQGKRFGFSEKHRLKSKKAIDELFQTGQYRSYGFLRFRYIPQDQGYLKVVISISKRVGNSPARNRLKRLIREALRLSSCLDQKPYNCGIYVTSPPYQTPTLAEVQDYLGRFISSLPQ